MTQPVRIHFGSSFSNRPEAKRQIRSALEKSMAPVSPSGPDVPTWIVIREEIEGTSMYIAHHTPSQFTLTADTVGALCDRVDVEMGNDTRYDNPAYRLNGHPDGRPDPGRSDLDPSEDD